MPVAVPKPTVEERKKIELTELYSFLCGIDNERKNANFASYLALLETTGKCESIVGGMKMSEHLKAIEDMHMHERLLLSLLEDYMPEVDRCLAGPGTM